MMLCIVLFSNSDTVLDSGITSLVEALPYGVLPCYKPDAVYISLHYYRIDQLADTSIE